MKIWLAALLLVSPSMLAQTAVTTTSGTANTVPKYNGSATVVNSAISDNGTTVSVTEPVAITGTAPSLGVGTSTPGGNASIVVDNIYNETGLHILNTNSLGYSVLRLGVDANATTGLGLYQMNNISYSPSLPAYGSGLAGFGTGGLSIATSDPSAPIRFYTAGGNLSNERVRITAAGFFGIGTTTPSQALEVNGSIKLTAGSANGLIFQDGTTQNTAFTGTATSLPSTIVSSSLTSVGIITSGTWHGTPIATAYLPSDLVFTDTAQNITGQKSFSSNVGIGNTSPSGRLDIVTTSDTTGNPSSFGPQHLVVGTGVASGAGSGGVFISYDQTHNQGYIGSVSPSVAWRNLILQPVSGNVGIGTTSPVAPFQIGSWTALQNPVAAQSALSFNTYYDGSVWRYLNTGAASSFRMVGGNINFNTIASGTAGTTASTMDTTGLKMVLFNSGGLALGNSVTATDPGAANLKVAGTVTAGAGLIYPDGSTQSTAYTGTSTGLPATVHSSSLTSVGTITAGTWQGTPIAAAYLPSDLVFTDTAQTITGQKSFSSKVGIGTTSPSFMLDVASGAIRHSVGSVAGVNDPVTFEAGAGYTTGSRTTLSWTQQNGALELARFGLEYTNPFMSFVFRDMYNSGAGTGEIMRVQGNGNVGIGTSSPQTTFHLSGTNATVTGNGTAFGNGNALIQGTGNRSTSAGAALAFAMAANTDGTNVWEQGRILATADNSNTGDASGRLYLQTRYLSGSAWNWRNNLVLTSNGNVGIGTTSPAFALDVQGGQVNAAAGLAINGTTVINSSGVWVGSSSGLIGPQGATGATGAQGPVGATGPQGPAGSAGASPWVLSGSSAYYNAGNVGIGITTPVATLDVSGYIHASGSTNPTTTAQGAYLGWNALTGGLGETDFINSQGGGAGGFAFMKANSDGTRTALDFIDGSGNLGLGTTTPGAKLEVNGSVKLTANSGASVTFPDSTVQSTAWNGVLTGGDYAESVNVSGDRERYEPGDVLVIDPDSEGNFLKSSTPYSTAVTGIYSTRPGVVGRRQLTARAHMKEEVPMAMTGIVPTKVSAENGPIKPGDLLVTSSKSGYAMKGTDRPQMLGAVIGKAIGHLDSGVGIIEAVVTLQ